VAASTVEAVGSSGIAARSAGGVQCSCGTADSSAEVTAAEVTAAEVTAAEVKSDNACGEKDVDVCGMQINIPRH
jgi:hypothetical protein